jgi:hypothetical protein
LLFRVSFGLKPDGAEAGRDAGLGGTPPCLTTPDAQPVAQLGRRPVTSPPPPPPAPGAAGSGATRLGQLGPGGQDNPTATCPAPVRPGRCSLCHLPWAAAGGAHQPLVIGVSWAARDCNGSPARSLPPAPQGEAAVGGARAGAATDASDGSPLALCAGLRVCGTGPLVIGVSWAARDCDGSPARSLPPAPQGEAAVGGARAEAATDGSPLALCAGLRVCGTGPVTGVSAGRERWGPSHFFPISFSNFFRNFFRGSRV